MVGIYTWYCNYAVQLESRTQPCSHSPWAWLSKRSCRNCHSYRIQLYLSYIYVHIYIPFTRHQTAVHNRGVRERRWTICTELAHLAQRLSSGGGSVAKLLRAIQLYAQRRLAIVGTSQKLPVTPRATHMPLRKGLRHRTARDCTAGQLHLMSSSTKA